MANSTGWTRAALAVAARPALWPTAARQTLRLARARWWTRPPFLPLPDRAYLAFRLETQYGDAHARPAARDVVAYLRWCRAQDARLGRDGDGRGIGGPR